MQSILVKPYVLECLNRFERERQEREEREQEINPKHRVVFQSTQKQMAKLHRQMQLEKERKAKELAEKGEEPLNSDLEDSTDSSEEDMVVS